MSDDAEIAVVKLYRYEDRTYASSLDEFDNPTGPGRTAVELREFRVFKTTAKGVWIYLWNHSDADKRFVNLTARKQFACKSKELAKESFIHRKQAHLRILLAQASRVKKALGMVGVQVVVSDGVFSGLNIQYKKIDQPAFK